MTSIENKTFLAFDTSTEYCSVALLAAGRCRSRTERLGNGHSDVLLPWIDALVKEAGIGLKDIDGILFGAGPGSFTGLRIACGIAQGLGFGLDKKVLGVCTLDAMAYPYRREAARIAVLNDARMNECYGAVYETADGLRKICNEQIVKPEMAAQWLAEQHVGFVAGTAIGVYPMQIELPCVKTHPEASRMIEWYLADEKANASLWVKSDLAAPIYVRNHVALTIKERREGEKL